MTKRRDTFILVPSPGKGEEAQGVLTSWLRDIEGHEGYLGGAVLQESANELLPDTLVLTLDFESTDAIRAFRKEIGEGYKKQDIRITMLAFLVKASVAALKAHPIFNASLDGDDLVLKSYYNVGFAADTPNGLMVPVITEADAKGVAAIAEELGSLSGQAREGKLKPGDMSGSTFTISSLGGIGGTAFTPIINAPEVAILGVTRSAMKPVWNGSEFKPRLILPLSLSYDHRVIDGAAAARFAKDLAALLTDLRRALL